MRFCFDKVQCNRLEHLFFFFQAEDGIRYLTVTGVQTCALPIFHGDFEVGINRVLSKSDKQFIRALYPPPDRPTTLVVGTPVTRETIGRRGEAHYLDRKSVV